MVSAACPRCHILVVEGNDSSFGALAAAEDTAARLGAAVISNSYGIPESGFPLTFSRSYDHPGHTIVVSSGDTGFTAAQFPADQDSVTAVGGTQLVRTKSARGWAEKVWNEGGGAGGSGCSSYVPKPAWQHDPHCDMRTIADVAAVASNLAVYDPHEGGWLTVGGTSAAAPIIAGVYGLAANATTIKPGYIYRHARSLFDITRGNNDLFHQAGGGACGHDYLCQARLGYDAPTGVGTPNGTGAF
jgi:subtilase family serine protease